MDDAEPHELIELEQVIRDGGHHVDTAVICDVEAGTRRFPLHMIALGNRSPDAPAVGFFGGFHGLERIGAEVVIAYLRSLVKRLRWDSQLHHQLESVRPSSTLPECGEALGPTRTG